MLRPAGRIAVAGRHIECGTESRPIAQVSTNINGAKRHFATRVRLNETAAGVEDNIPLGFFAMLHNGVCRQIWGEVGVIELVLARQPQDLWPGSVHDLSSICWVSPAAARLP